MPKHIFLLTDGEIENKETTLNLIGSYSDKFTLHSLGIDDCDLDLIKRTAIMGNGNSFFISNLDKLNKSVIDALEGALKSNNIMLNFENNYKNKNYIEYNQKQVTGENNFLRYGFILKEKEIKDIIILIKITKDNKTEDLKIIFNKENNNIKKLPDGDKLGKIIVDNYLKGNKSINDNTKIKLSKDFNILTSKTAFYAEIQNELPSQEKMVTYTNKNAESINNKNEDKNMIIKENDFELNDFGYDNLVYEHKQENKQSQKKSFFNFFSNLFSKKTEIIKKKTFIYKSPKKIGSKTREYLEADCCCYESAPPDFEERDDDYFISSPFLESYEKNTKKVKILNFDELILSQDIFDGNWENNENVQILIEEEKSIYEKIKKISEEKGIKEENGFITLLVLYYIYNKNSSKVDELKFVINKAKDYIKIIYNLEYDDISKEI